MDSGKSRKIREFPYIPYSCGVATTWPITLVFVAILALKPFGSSQKYSLAKQGSAVSDSRAGEAPLRV